MKFINKIKTEGISLRATHLVVMIGTFAMAVLLLWQTFGAVSLYSKLTSISDDYIDLQKSAEDLMEASDYLTDKVQLFTVTMDPEDMNAYFDEVYNVRRRENAIEKIEEVAGDSKAFREIQLAMSSSNDLMATEIHAMKLICDAENITDTPEDVAVLLLTGEEQSLSEEEKISRARDMVHDKSYYQQKLEIRTAMDGCIDALIDDTHTAELELNDELHKKIYTIRLLLVISTVVMIVVLWMTSYLGINPILKGVKRIKENRRIPMIGSYEFRYLAKTYNKMYDAFQKSIENLNYDASHDKLTGLYNRAGYEVLCAGIDIPTTAVLMIDADKFKEINDSHGHAEGDKVLRKIADTLKHTFRHEDYICRLGGDEFLVFMLHMGDDRRDLIELKASLINKRLSDNSDGVSPISVSIGVNFGKGETDLHTFIKHADEALYNVKYSGRGGCGFYSPDDMVKLVEDNS